MAHISEDISVQWLANQLRRAHHKLSEQDWELAYGSVDVCLQATEHDGWLHVGDACYDTDHTGYWGQGTLTPEMYLSDFIELAEGMIAEAREDAQEDSDE